MIILGIDPGYATVGYGVVNYVRGRFAPVRFGAITTPPKTDFSARLEMIYDDMTVLLDKSQPQALSIEQLFFSNNKTTAIDVAQARGVILLSARKHGVPVFEYTPMQVKQVGYGLAEKKQVMEMTRMLLGLEAVPRPDDTADALALAICHGHSAGSLLSRMK